MSHMVPSVTDAQKRKLLSDSIFDQKDLFAPASIEAAREAARDVSLYRGAQSRPSASSGSTQRRQFSLSSSSRGRPHSSPLSTSLLHYLKTLLHYLKKGINLILVIIDQLVSHQLYAN